MSEQPVVAVAMSGGVDSSVVAGLLKKQGRTVVGMTMQLWNQRRLPQLQSDAASGRCCSLDDVYDARAVANYFDIPYYVVNFEHGFEQSVVKPFIESYLKGDTPVPCTLCNNYVKFDQFLEMADAVNAPKVATGHYARLHFDEAGARWQLLRARDTTKDQTYFLWGLTQAQLARASFPLGDMLKLDVRSLAGELGIPIADKPDSQEICFVPNGDYAAFIEAYFVEQGMARPETTGDIVSTAGRRLGSHAGTHRFTVGQRKGLGIATGEALYVIQTNPATQQVTVGRDADLQRSGFEVRDVNWVSIAEPRDAVRADVRIRNKHVPAPASIHALAGLRARVEFDEPQRAITPGQAAVFYDGDVVLGGGWIA